MQNYLETHIEFLTAVESSIKAWRCKLMLWKETRRIGKLARQHADIVSRLDTRIRYDVGNSDCRPLPPKSALSEQKTYSVSVEAMMNRFI